MPVTINSSDDEPGRMLAELRFRNGVRSDVWRMRRIQGFVGVDVRDDELKARGRKLSLQLSVASLLCTLREPLRPALLRRQAD